MTYVSEIPFPAAIHGLLTTSSSIIYSYEGSNESKTRIENPQRNKTIKINWWISFWLLHSFLGD